MLEVILLQAHTTSYHLTLPASFTLEELRALPVMHISSVTYWLPIHDSVFPVVPSFVDSNQANTIVLK